MCLGTEHGLSRGSQKQEIREENLGAILILLLVFVLTVLSYLVYLAG